MLNVSKLNLLEIFNTVVVCRLILPVAYKMIPLTRYIISAMNVESVNDINVQISTRTSMQNRCILWGLHYRAISESSAST